MLVEIDILELTRKKNRAYNDYCDSKLRSFIQNMLR